MHDTRSHTAFMIWNGYKSEYSINARYKTTSTSMQDTRKIRWESEQSTRAVNESSPHHVSVEGFWDETLPQMSGIFYALRRVCFTVLRPPPLSSGAVFMVPVTTFSPPVAVPGVSPLNFSPTAGYGTVKPTLLP